MDDGEQAPDAGPLVPAGPGQRLAAITIDYVIMIVVFVICGIAGATGGLAGVIWVAVSLAVQLPLARGHTPGMAVLGIEAYRVSGAAKPGLARALVRWFVPLAAVGTPILLLRLATGGLGAEQSSRPGWFPTVSTSLTAAALVAVYIGVWLDPRRQGLHDKAAGTLILAPADADEDAADEVTDD